MTLHEEETELPSLNIALTSVGEMPRPEDMREFTNFGWNLTERSVLTFMANEEPGQRYIIARFDRERRN